MKVSDVAEFAARNAAEAQFRHDRTPGSYLMVQTMFAGEVSGYLKVLEKIHGENFRAIVNSKKRIVTVASENFNYTFEFPDV